jgi:hypothetical protein
VDHAPTFKDKVSVGRPAAETLEGKHAPLHVAPLCTAQGENAIFCKDVEGQGINSLLINHNKTLPFFSRVYCLVTDQILELYNFLHPLVCEFTYRLDEFLTLLRRRVEESRIHFAVVPLVNAAESTIEENGLRLLVLQADVERQNVSVLALLGHVWMTRVMVKNKPTNQLCLRGGMVLHFHDFDHVKIDRFSPLVLGILEIIG